MSKHTPEPWDRNTFPVIENFRTTDPIPPDYNRDYLQCHVLPKSSYGRAQDCVNALAGIPDPEAYMDELKAENARLRDALDEIAHGHNSWFDSIATAKQALKGTQQ